MNDKRKDLIQKFAALGSLIVLGLVFALSSDAFFTVGRRGFANAGQSG